MRLNFKLAVVVLILFALAAVPLSALAQQDPATTVDLGPAVQSLLGYLSVAISALVAATIGIITARLYSWAGISIEATHREALHSAAMSGINNALGKLSGRIGGKAIDVRSTVVAEALRYVLGSVPDAVRFFQRQGVGEDKLRELIAAKFGQVERDNSRILPTINVTVPESRTGQAG